MKESAGSLVKVVEKAFEEESLIICYERYADKCKFRGKTD